MRRWILSVVLALGILSISGNAFSQVSNITPWPNNPPVGIGTQLSFGAVPQNALHIHYDPGHFPPTLPAMIRLSEGDSTNMQYYGLLGIMPLGTTTYSSLSTGDDLILHEHQGGDIIITNYSTVNPTFAHGTAIRLATTSDSAHRPLFPTTAHDLERETIDRNGNIGFDLPPDSITGLGNPLDQVQIGGGGTVLAAGEAAPSPGLTLYGGNRFQNMIEPGGGIFPWDSPYLGYNFRLDHLQSMTDTADRHRRFQPMGSAALTMSEGTGGTGGLMNLACYPYNSDSGINNFTNDVMLQLTGNGGLEMWCNVSASDLYHNLFACYRPGYLHGAVTRNTNGLFFHYTPVYIGSVDVSEPEVDFQNFVNVRPNIGDDTTWLLAVDGPALFKEAWVNTNDWPDFVFLPDYKLMSIKDFGNYIASNHHLPALPSAKEMGTGLPLGKTEADLTKQVEEMALYIVQLNKEVEALKTEMKDLMKGGK